MKGIIYKYTSPSGKVYIGQTTNEKKRKRVFLNENNEDYAGLKINNARKKYGPKSFKYEVLEKRFREMAFLTKGLRITIEDLREETPKKADFCFEGGLKSFVEFFCVLSNWSPIHQKRKGLMKMPKQ
mgnify:CR=1 FL=1